jgi:peptidoglycan hydrolase-like protein with peptidoglycan-binding domain
MRDRKKTLLIVGGIAVAALGIGVAAGQYVTSPADAAADAEPPEAGAITAPVEFRTLDSTLVIRGDAKFASSVEVTPEVSSLTVPPIITGHVPEVGDEIKESDPLLDIAGRPVLALQGKLPMYRTLRPGLSGPDVKQLEEALERLDYDPGKVDEDYTSSTGEAVAQMFEDAGYAAPPADEEAQAGVDMAKDGVDAAQSELDSAEQILADVSKGPSKIEKKQAEQAVDNAERMLKDAKDSEDSNAIASAQDELDLAKLQLEELLEGPDISAEQNAVSSARTRLSEAQQELSDATASAGTPLPAAEVVYLDKLPRRVDSVEVERGDEVNGATMTVSGADMVIVANVNDADREPLEVDMPVELDLPTGAQAEGVITEIEPAKGDDASGYDVTIVPEDLEPEEVDALREANVRVAIPISSTGGDVLAVPVAAITSGPGGESRVEVLRGEDDETVLVTVDVGLTAESYAEVTPKAGELDEGDLVVVGR